MEKSHRGVGKQPSIGRSLTAGSRGWRRTITALEDDAACLVGDTLSDATLPKMAERILAQAPVRLALAGVSMGGVVAMEIMKLDPGRVARRALVDTNAGPDTFATASLGCADIPWHPLGVPAPSSSNGRSADVQTDQNKSLLVALDA